MPAKNTITALMAAMRSELKSGYQSMKDLLKNGIRAGRNLRPAQRKTGSNYLLSGVNRTFSNSAEASAPCK